MANSTSKKRRKVIVFSLIGLSLLALTGVALFKKRDVFISVQSEKVARRNLTELVTANGKIQPVIQVKISPEVSGEIIQLPVKEGQRVTKGDLIVKIKPDTYLAYRNQAEAAYKSSLAAKATAQANLHKLELEFKRNQNLFNAKLISDSAFEECSAAYDVAKAQLNNSEHQVEMSYASLASAEDNLAKTTIVSPLTGTVSKLNSEVGERVVGTATMAGTEIMTLADLNEMEARVDIGETDVILIAPGQTVHLEVDAFKERKFSGAVTEIANSSKSSAYSSSSQEATKFEIKIRIKEKEAFRPGMSVTAEIETRVRTNVLSVPIASVTTRVPKTNSAALKSSIAGARSTSATNAPNSASARASAAAPKATNAPALALESSGTSTASNALARATNSAGLSSTNLAKSDKKTKESTKPVEVVFVLEADHVRMVPIKIGISDDTHWEITEGLQEGQEVVSGGYRAISRDLDDGKKVRKGAAGSEDKKDKPDASKGS